MCQAGHWECNIQEDTSGPGPCPAWRTKNNGKAGVEKYDKL